MKATILLCLLFALAVSQCPTKTSVWRIKDLPQLGNDIDFRFQRRLNDAGECLHYFQIKSLCTLYEATYTTTHGTGVISYTINEATTPPVNLEGCPNFRIAQQEFRIILSFWEPPKSGEYELFLGPFGQPNNHKLDWGGYLAKWISGPARVWFS